jgi:hypothetical protein
MGLSFLMALARDKEGKPRFQKGGRARWIPFLMAMIIAGSLAAWAVLSSSVISDPTTPDRFTSGVSILEDPRHQLGGAAPFFLRFPWIGRAGIFETYPEAVILLLMLILSGAVSYLLPNKTINNIPKPLWYLLVSGICMYGVSMITLLGFSLKVLYMPSRYVRGALFLIPVFFLSTHADAILSSFDKWIHESRVKEKMACFLATVFGTVIITGIVFGFSFPDWLGWALIILGGVLISGMSLLWFFKLSRKIYCKDWKTESLREQLLFGSLGAIILAGFFFYSRLVGYGTIKPTKHERELYSYLKTLSKDVLLAGSPEELTAVPLFAKRSVLFHALRPKESAPIIEMYNAYYAEDGDEIVSFCENYDVDYLIIDEDDFAPAYISQGDFFYEPYNQLIQDIISRRTQFALPKAKAVFNSGPLRVVPCRLSSFTQIESG